MMLAAFIYLSWGGWIAAIAFLCCKPNPLTFAVFLLFMVLSFYSVMIV